MKLRVYLLRMAVGAAAFVFGIGIFGAVQFLSSFYNTAKPKAEATKMEKPKDEATTENIKPPADFFEPIEQPAAEPDSDASGAYGIIEDLPKEFKDFSYIDIAERDYASMSEENPDGKPIVPEGFFETTARKYKFTRISISRKFITFETETKKGISYKFVGEFTGGGDETGAIFKGRLTKMRDGKKVASGKFGFTHTGC
jgi:hypothetical protein